MNSKLLLLNAFTLSVLLASHLQPNHQDPAQMPANQHLVRQQAPKLAIFTQQQAGKLKLVHNGQSTQSVTQSVEHWTF